MFIFFDVNFSEGLSVGEKLHLWANLRLWSSGFYERCWHPVSPKSCDWHIISTIHDTLLDGKGPGIWNGYSLPKQNWSSACGILAHTVLISSKSSFAFVILQIILSSHTERFLFIVNAGVGFGTYILLGRWWSCSMPCCLWFRQAFGRTRHRC
jgi:hypothetical protein